MIQLTDFVLLHSGKSVPLLISSTDYPGVIRALRDLQQDIGAVTHAEPGLFMDTIPSERNILIAGTFGSPIIDKLVNSGLLNTDIKGKWETYRIQVVKNPFPGVDEALVIAGSDKRGTIYGIYELSKKDGCVALVLVGRCKTWFQGCNMCKKRNVF